MTSTIRRPLSFLILLTALHSGAGAQLVPERLYYGKGRAIPMLVKVPEAPPAAAPSPAAPDAPTPAPTTPPQIEIQLLEPVTAKPLARASAMAGKVDLAALFPDLWQSATPRLVFAQLVVNERKLGPAVVLQPMLTPVTASMDLRNPQAPQVVFPPAEKRERTYSGLRAYVDQDVLLTTDKGEIRLRLRPDAAPNTCWNFRDLVAGGLYTDVLFHRVIALDGNGKPFIIQTGDPTGTGNGGPGFHFNLEESTLKHDFGTVSMAREPRNPNANGSQFFIALSREGTRPLDGAYCAFAQTIDGAEVIAAIAKTPVSGPDGKPLRAPRLLSAKLVDAPPYGDGPNPVKIAGEDKVER